MLRADAAAAAHIHGAHDQQLHAVDLLGVGVRDIRHIGVQLEELIGGVGAGALLHQGAHFGDGDDGIHLLLAQSKSQAQVGVRVHVGGQDGDVPRRRRAAPAWRRAWFFPRRPCR